MNFDKLLDNLINEIIEEHQTPVRLLNEIDDDTYDYIVDQAADLKPGSMNSYFGGQQRVVIPLIASENEEIKKFYDEVVIPLASKGLRVDLKDGVAVKEVETQRGKQERKIKLGKVIGKQLPEETQKWWNKVQAKFLGNPEVLDNKYSIVISQNPVDVARMSDHREIQSCHSPGSDYFQCALADARRAGAIAYLIDSDDAPYIESHLNDPEVFVDRDRGTEGVTPLARVRLRRFDYVEPDNGFIDAFLVPESRIYGRSVPGFLNSVIDWAREEQDDHPFFKKQLDPSNIYHRGGSYSDSAFSAMFNNLLGLENIELNDDLEMYPHSMPMINDTTDEQYVDHVSGEGLQRQMDHGEEMMSDLNHEYFNHDDVNLDYDLEWDEWGESVVVESWKVTVEFDLPVHAILNSEFVKNNESVNVDPEDPLTIQQDELNHNSVWGHIESLVEEAYENSDHYNEYLEQPEYDAQAELIRFGTDSKLIYRIKLIWEGGGEPIPVFNENIAQEIYNIHNYYDELKIEIVEKLIEEEVYAPTKYQKLRKSIEFDEDEYLNRLDGEKLGHFRIEFQSGHLTAYTHEKLDNYPAPGIRKIGKFPEWVKSNESPPLAHVMGFDAHNFSGMSTTIAYSPKRIIGMLLNPMWGDKVIAHLESDLVDASVAAHNQLALAFDASDRDAEEDKEWGERKDALEVLRSIKVYFSADVIYLGGETYSATNKPSRRGTGGLYFKFNETDNEYTIKGLVQFLKYFDEHYDVVQTAIQKVWDEFVDAYNENAPIAQEEGVQFLRNMIQEVIEEDLRIDKHPQADLIKKAVGDENHLISFSDINKVGLNPGTSFNTPAGIYGWHFTQRTLRRAKKNKIFASERKYGHLLKIKNPDKVLWLGTDQTGTSAKSPAEAMKLFTKAYPVLNEPKIQLDDEGVVNPQYDGDGGKKISAAEWLRDSEVVAGYRTTSSRQTGGESKSEKLYDLVMATSAVLELDMVAGKKRTVAANALLRSLGIDAVVDKDCKGVIHNAETCQGFFTHKGGLEHVATIENRLYNLNKTAVSRILQSPNAPEDKLWDAINALTKDFALDLGSDDPEFGDEISTDDALDILKDAVGGLGIYETGVEGGNKNLTADMLTHIFKFAAPRQENSVVAQVLMEDVLEHPNAPQELLKSYMETAIKEGNSKILAAIAANPEMTTEELTKIAEAGQAVDHRVEVALGRNVNTSPEVLAKLAEMFLSGGSAAGSIVALKNPNTPVETVNKWAGRYAHFRELSTQNPARPLAALSNPNVDDSIVAGLIFDENAEVKEDFKTLRDVGKLENLPAEYMEELVNWLARGNYSQSSMNAANITDTFNALFSNKTITSSQLYRLLKSYPEVLPHGNEDWEYVMAWVMWEVLNHDNLSREVLELANDLWVKDSVRMVNDGIITKNRFDAVNNLFSEKEKKAGNQKESIQNTLKQMIKEQIKIAIGEKQEDTAEVTKAVVQDGRRVLLIKRSDYSESFPRKWDLPGGHIHVGEDKEVGLRREVEEETGLVIGEVNELYPFKHETFYITNLPEGKIKLSPEHTEYKMVDIREIPGYDNLTAKYKDAILTAMEDAPLAENLAVTVDWPDLIQKKVQEFLPDAEIRDIQRIGSSALSREEQVAQDMEKYGYVREPEDRDTDIEVQVTGIFPEDIERWAFSEEAEELEQFHNYDVQLRIVENKIISEMFVKGHEDGDNIIAYKENIWKLRIDIEEDDPVHQEIAQALRLEGEWNDIWDLKELVEDAGRTDILVGEFNEQDRQLSLQRVGSFHLDPKSSVLVKKVVKTIGAQSVVYAPNDEGEEYTSKYNIKGKVADIMYHGTTSNYLPGLLRLGLVPGKKETNYEGISHPSAVFFTSRFDEAQHHATHTAKKVGGDPVILELKVPDPALLIPDYDVDMGAGDTGCYD